MNLKNFIRLKINILFTWICKVRHWHDSWSIPFDKGIVIGANWLLITGGNSWCKAFKKTGSEWIEEKIGKIGGLNFAELGIGCFKCARKDGGNDGEDDESMAVGQHEIVIGKQHCLLARKLANEPVWLRKIFVYLFSS